METITLLQHYWWLIISLLGALLVFLLFVQGGQGLLYCLGRTEEERNMLVNSLGRKWEFTFTTLVTFGGAFFASFPLFYSTSFGGAYYVWMTILLSFVIQPVAYQFRRKASNVFGEKTFDVFLTINGIAGPLLLGTAVGTLFTGANFTVDRLNLANGAGSGSATVISQWTTPWHGLEALGDMRNVALGLAVMFLAGMLACQYFMNNIADETLFARARRRMLTLAAPFLVFFLTFFVWLLFPTAWRSMPQAGFHRAYKYLHNCSNAYLAAVLLLGVVAVLWSIGLGWRGRRNAIWFGGAGTVLTVLALLLCAGWNDTAYYPSLADMQSSLTIYNSSSSLFTLKVMSIVSLLIPFVAAYIWYAWRAMNRKPITREEIRGDDHQY
ncbi:MAG: cytochrome d ubiquinol oxidase subunit II [Alistipes finegoldii]